MPATVVTLMEQALVNVPVRSRVKVTLPPSSAIVTAFVVKLMIVALSKKAETVATLLEMLSALLASLVWPAAIPVGVLR